MDANTAAGLSVLLAVLGIGIGPLIFFFIEKDSQFVKTHSMQALVLIILEVILLSVGSVLAVVIIGFLIMPLAIVPWIFMVIQCVKAFQGEKYLAPVIGKMSAKWAGEDV